MVYQFDSELAQIFGVGEAILINNFAFWIRKNEANGKHFYEGRTWTYNSVDAFTKLFPFWSAGQIRRLLQSLIDKGVIITGNYNSSAYDRTTWYAFSDSILRNKKFHLLISTNGDSENDKPIPDNKRADKLKADNLYKGTSEPKCLFKNSRYADIDKFSEQFNSGDFAGIDITYYYRAVADWSAGKSVMRNDWIATARNFIRKDIAAGKVQRIRNLLSQDAIDYLQDMQ